MRLRALSLLLVVAGCQNATPATTSGEIPTATYVTRDLETQTWEPAGVLPEAQREIVEDFLQARSLKILLPPHDDEAGPSGLVATLGTTTHQPAGVTSVTLRLDSAQVGLSLKANQVGVVPTCADRLSDDSLAGVDAQWITSEVRRQPACLAVVENGISFMEWDETGIRFRVSWEGLVTEEVQTWLEAWTLLPRPGSSE
jgi:hypothetical protein